MNTSGEPPGADSGARRPFVSAERLGGISDSMFGVAVTLLAATLPPRLWRPTEAALELFHDLSGQLYSVALSFASAGTYWIIQQRRLGDDAFNHAAADAASFLLPVSHRVVAISTGLYVNYGPAAGVVTVDGAHLSLRWNGLMPGAGFGSRPSPSRC